MSNTIKFLHVPGSEDTNIQNLLRRAYNPQPAVVYGGYSVGYLVGSNSIKLAFAFCMDNGDNARDAFNKKEARALIRERFDRGDVVQLTARQLAPACFTLSISFDALTPQLIKTLVSTFVRNNLQRLRHHAPTGFVNFTPVTDLQAGQRRPSKAEREATRAARIERRAARVAERGEADPRG